MKGYEGFWDAVDAAGGGLSWRLAMINTYSIAARAFLRP